MRVMVLIKATKNSEEDVMPSEELLTAMGKYNEELVAAGVMLSGEGLKPTSDGKRITISNNGRNISDGPFDPATQLVAGLWIWQVGSMEEAIEWANKCPHPMPGEETELELRPLIEMEDFGAEMTPELREQENTLRQRLDGWS